MTVLTIFSTDESGAPARRLGATAEADAIARELDRIGVQFERWAADAVLPPGAGQEAVLAAYRKDVERLMKQGSYQSADVVRMHPDHPDREAFRAKFLAEHIHEDDEVRFFVEGAGAFYLRDGDRVLKVVATGGDLMRVPANARHWFDMGPAPHFAAIRLFTTPEGWVAKFTGDRIADRVPLYQP